MALEARSGLDPWVRADLPVPPTPKGLGWVGVVGPGVIVLGASIGSGEFLLGPAVFVRLRAIASLGDCGRDLPSDHLQYRGDALYAGHRGAGVHGLHAHASVVDCLGVVIRRPSTSCRSAGPRLRPPLPGRFSSCLRAVCLGQRTQRPSTTSAWGPFSRVWPCFRWGGASNARSNCSTGYSSCASWAASSPWPCSSSQRGRGWPRGPDSGALTWRAARSALFPAGADFFLLGALVAYSGCGGVVNITLVELGARQGLRHGRAGGLYPRCRRRAHGASRPQRFHLRARRRGHAPVAGVVAHRPSRSVGRVLHGRDSRHDPPGAAVCDVSPARDRHPGPRHQRCARVQRRRQGGRGARWSHCIPGGVDPVQDSARQPRGDGPLHYGHPLDRQQPGARLAQRRRARGVLQRAGGRRRVGDRGPAPGPADRPAETRGERRRVSSSSWRRCICSTSTRDCCRHTCARPCGGARLWWGCRFSTGSSSPSRSAAYGADRVA